MINILSGYKKMNNIRSSIDQYLKMTRTVNKEKITKVEDIWGLQKKISNKYNGLRHELISAIYQILNEEKMNEINLLLK